VAFAVVALTACIWPTPSLPTISFGSVASPADVTSSAAESTAVDVICPPGIIVPDGVDKNLVCGPAPQSTVVLPSVVIPGLGDDPLFGFVSPSRNLSCGLWDAGTVACQAVILDVPYPSDPRTAGVDTDCGRGMWVGDDGAGMVCNGGVIISDMLPDVPSAPVLGYGQIMLSTDYQNPYADPDFPVLDPIACLSAETGITCWNTVTAHGFSLARDFAVYW